MALARRSFWTPRTPRSDLFEQVEGIAGLWDRGRYKGQLLLVRNERYAAP